MSKNHRASGMIGLVDPSSQGSKLWFSYLRNRLTVLQWAKWVKGKGLGAPPPGAKWAVLQQFGDFEATWIETGTYFGLTTRWLSKKSTRVISLEPSADLVAFVRRRLRNRKNAEIVNEGSETALATALNSAGDRVCLFLDGHYSGGITFRGSNVSPILVELETLAAHLPSLSSCRVFVDDFRLFGEQDLDGSYPSPNLLVDFAAKHMDGWTIRNDVFVSWLHR